jgi:hypothetical protein
MEPERYMPHKLALILRQVIQGHNTLHYFSEVVTTQEEGEGEG